MMSAVVLALACCTLAAPAMAQFIVDHEKSGKQLRGLHGPAANSIKRSFEADRDALGTFREILAATGIPGMADRIQVRASAETANAEAQLGADGQRYIFYNSTFMRELSAKTRQYWSLVFVIAHEVGHHIAGHLDFAGDNHRVELEADRYAGFILGRMGASHDEAIAAVGAIGTGSASATHPPRDQRVQIVSLGWNDGAGPVRPRTDTPPRVADNPPPSPQTSSPAQRPTAPQRLVATEQPPPPAFTPPATPPAPAPRAGSSDVSYAYRVNTRLHGNVLKSGAQPDADACRTWCGTTIGCIGYQYGKETPQVKETVCELYSQVTKRSTDANWRSGVVSALALSLPVAYDAPATPGPVAKQPAAKAPAPAAPKSVEAPLRFGYKTRTNSGVVGELLKESTVDQPLNCLLACMNVSLCGAATFTPAAAGKGQCKTYTDVKQILSDAPGDVTAIHKQ
jgi:hypothetical protein